MPVWFTICRVQFTDSNHFTCPHSWAIGRTGMDKPFWWKRWVCTLCFEWKKKKIWEARSCWAFTWRKTVMGFALFSSPFPHKVPALGSNCLHDLLIGKGDPSYLSSLSLCFVVGLVAVNLAGLVRLSLNLTVDGYWYLTIETVQSQNKIVCHYFKWVISSLVLFLFKTN